MVRYGLSAVVVVLGTALVTLSVTADAIWGASGSYAFGWEQKLGVAIGMTAAWVGCLSLIGWTPRAGRVSESATDAQPARHPAAASL